MCAACYITGIIENLAAYTAPFQIADAALHLTLGLKKLAEIGSVEKLARANRLTKCHSYSYTTLNVCVKFVPVYAK